MTRRNTTEALNYRKLASLCETLRTLLYVDQDPDAAHAHLSTMRSLLDRLPKNDRSIIGAEGRAIRWELSGNIRRAITWRLREMELMRRLYADIRENDYEEKIKRDLLAGRDKEAFRTRRAIVTSLRRKLRSGD